MQKNNGLVSVLTIHFGVNYGSVLQTYAMGKTLENMGYSYKLIDYVPNRYNSWTLVSKNKKSKYPFFIILAYFIFNTPKREYQRYIFRNFLKKNVNLSRKYKTGQELKNAKPKADVYLVGSDQVWNYDYNDYGDYTYLFDFLDEEDKRISYAASIGKDELNKDEIVPFQNHLSKFKKILVREDNAVDILNCLDIKADHVLDPSFFLDKEEWYKIIKPVEKCKNKYIAIYVMDNLYSDLINIADSIAKKNNWEIHVVTFKKTKDNRVDKEYIFLRPFEFLDVIKNAEFVVTNSFHGTAFSVNFNKQFIAVGKSNYNSRMKSLLKMFDLEDRFVSLKEKESSISLKEIDYNVVNIKLDAWRKKSINMLQEGLE